MRNMRAKLKVAEVQSHGQSQVLVFNAVAKKEGYQSDGSGDENNTFARWTPNAYLTMTVNNPALLGAFNVGDEFYVDFTKAG